MGTKTGIEWTDSTWNPLRGCSRVSEGCRNCYAEKMAARFSGTGQPYEGLAAVWCGNPAWTGRVELVEKHLLDPLKWGPVRGYDADDGTRMDRPRRIFVNSMSDMFHENVSDEMLDRIFAVMVLCPQHVFQVLTKRPERMLRYFKSGPRPSTMTCPRQNHILNVCDFMTRPGAPWEKHKDACDLLRITLAKNKWKWPLPNVWLGVSVENQAAADERIPLLLQTPAAVRFVSCEPLLGQLILGGWVGFLPNDEIGGIGLSLDWVICGGESGPGARPMHPDWARSLRDQCQAEGVPFFFKQWGEWHEVEKDDSEYPFCPRMVRRGDAFVTPGGAFDLLGPDLCSQYESTAMPMRRIGKHAAGSLLDGREHKAFPAVRG